MPGVSPAVNGLEPIEIITLEQAADTLNLQTETLVGRNNAGICFVLLCFSPLSKVEQLKHTTVNLLFVNEGLTAQKGKGERNLFKRIRM